MTIEAAGDAMTGGLIGRAIEPEHGEDAPGRDGHTHETHCLNCGTALAGAYCHVCGQHAHVHRTLSALAHDLLHGVFHFEGKVWRTVPKLFWDPGDLTRRYIHGERAKFVSPLALFLFSVFLMFAVFEGIGGPIEFNGPSPFELESGKAEATRDISKLEQKRAELLAARQPTAAIDEQLLEARAAKSVLDTASKVTKDEVGSATIDLPDNFRVQIFNQDYTERARKALKNPKYLLYKMQSSAYKFSWALIPLSLPFMALIFAWKRRYKLYDHAVFVTYSITFVMLLLVTMALSRSIGIDLSMAVLLVPVHFFWQLRSAYALPVVGALWRTVVLMIVSIFVLIGFGAILLTLGLSG